MRIGILSDWHANLPAAQACIDDLNSESVDVLVSLGDVFGYGPWVNECTDLVRESCAFSLIGNHEQAVGRNLGCYIDHHSNDELYREIMRRMFEWTAESLNTENRSFLNSLFEKGDYLFTNGKLGLYDTPISFSHANPSLPVNMGYITNATSAKIFCLNVPNVRTRYNFVGHTHQPQLHLLNYDAEFESEQLKGPCNRDISKVLKAVVGIPGLGQSRDGDPRAGSCIFDTSSKKLEIRRVEYDVDAVIQKLKQTPVLKDIPYLQERLLIGR